MYSIPVDALKDVELLVDLDELEGGPRPPALLLGQPVVDVALVLRRSAHFRPN